LPGFEIFDVCLVASDSTPLAAVNNIIIISDIR
jgi:hypothetical protein